MRANNITIELLGGLRISGADGETTEISSRQAGRVLAHLAVRLRRTHAREELVDLFWPDDGLDEGRAKLSKALHTIRGWMARAGVDPDSALLAGRTEIGLNGALVATDAARMQESLTAATKAMDASYRAGFLEEAVSLYRGELLPGFYDECFDTERNRLAMAHESALRDLSLAFEELGELDRALEIALRLVALGPTNEDAHCTVMRLFALRGQPAAVTRQYHELERALEAELGEKPCENTRLLMESLAQSGCETRSANQVPSTPQSSQTLPINLPHPATRFIGRETELAEVRELLESSRLLTMTGAGGCGKTRLAYRAVEDLLASYPDGIWLAELAPLADPGLVPQAVASALRLREEPGKPLSRTLTDHLKSRSLLLILDNCEHLLVACAELSDLILRECRHVGILCTSRERLGVPGEQTYRVPSLSLPDHRAAVPEELTRYEAVRLFVDRARLQNATFAVTPKNADALASVCRGLDGIPLAIELAAARVRSMSVEELNRGLDDRFRLLTGGGRTAPPRQQTLSALIEWSYDLLNEAEKALFCRLSVFAGGWTLEAAESVCSDGEAAIHDPEPKIQNHVLFDLLASLMDKSLVVAEEQDGATRYRMLETVRQYASDRLSETGESESWRGRHLAVFLALAEEAEPQLTGPDQQEWLERLEEEHDNLRAALAFSIHPSVPDAPAEQLTHFSAEMGLRLSGALGQFWERRGYFREGRSWYRSALENSIVESRSSARAKATDGAGKLAARQGDYSGARALIEEALSIRRQLGDLRGIARSLGYLGNVSFDQGDFISARSMYGESLSIARELDDRPGIAVALRRVAHVAHDFGDYASARALQDESLAILRQLGDRRGIAIALNNLGFLEFDEGNYPIARRLHEECLSILRALDDRAMIAMSVNNLGDVACEQGSYAEARMLQNESLAIRFDLGDRRGVAESLDALGDLAAAESEPGRAARIWGSALILREELGSFISPNEKGRFDERVAAARNALGADAFAAAWAEGRAMSMEQAVEYALSDA